MDQSWLSKANKASNPPVCRKRIGWFDPGPRRDDLTVDALVRILREGLQPEVMTRAWGPAGRLHSQSCVHGARIAGDRLVQEFS